MRSPLWFGVAGIIVVMTLWQRSKAARNRTRPI